MSEKFHKQLETLAQTLVTPERFGRLALAPVVELHELAQLYDFPSQEQ